MSDKLTLCQQWRIYQKQTTDRLSYQSWLESQLTQARADKAELLQVMQKIYDEGCTGIIEPFELVEPLLKKHG